MAEQMSTKSVTVVRIDGNVVLRDATGKSVPLKEGQQLNENEIFVTSADGRVQLLMPNGELLEIGGDRTTQVDAQMLGTSPVDVASAAIADLNATTDQIAAAIASGTDLTTELEATAAGLGGAGGAQDGHSFVQLGRIAEGVNPLAFSFAGSDLATTELPIVGALPIQPSPNPAILGADVVNVSEDTPATGNVLSNDSDADGPLTVTGFTVAGLPNTFAANQQAIIPNVGTLQIAPNGDFTFNPAANFNGPVPVITYNVVDPVGGTGSSTLTLNVTPVDDASNIQPDVATAIEDTPVTGNVISNDSDPDGPLTVTGFTVAGVPGTFTAGQPASIPNVGVLLITPNGDYTFTPVANYNGTVPTITYNVVDPQGGTGSSTLTISITPVNDPASLQPDTATLLEDTPATGNVLTNDSDPDGPLTVTGFTIAGLTGTFNTNQPANIPGIGTLVIAPNGDYSFTPENNYDGPVPVVTYNVVDPLGGTGSSTLSLTITPVEDPVISAIEAGSPGTGDDNVVEGNNLVFNVTLSTATTKVETYAFNLGGGTASTADYGTPTFNNGVTYDPATGLITVPAGVTTFAVTLPTVDDTAVEATPETVPLNIGGVSATGGILDNDSPSITKVEVGNPGVADDNVVEGNNLVFNVTLSTATTKVETYVFNLGGGTASTADYGTPSFNNGITYDPATGLITVPAGVTTFAVILPTVDDTAVEATPETVPLSIGGVSATGGILDNDSPAISKIEVGNPGTSDDNVVEGNNLVFNVTLSTATTKTETYAFNLGGGSASAADYGTPSFNNGVTYDPATGLITVPAGVTTFAVTLPTVDDTAVEATPETVPLSIGGVSATGGILDNDSPAISKIEVGNPGTSDDNVVEGNNLVFNVTLSTATTKVETYAFNLGGGSASAADYGTPSFNNGVTYDPVTGKITVPAGVTTFAVTLPTVDDTAVEATPETVPLSIGGVSATGGILDNDSPAISKIEVGNPGATDDNVVEGNNLVFNVTLSTATTKTETYAFNLGGGSASAADYGTPSFNNGVTYDPATGLITVPAGVTTFAVTLPTVDDTAVEATPETVPLSIGGVSATGGILDNDSPAISKIEVGNPGTSDDNVVEGNNLVFNVTLSTATTKVETYAFNLGGGTASTADYGTPTFNNGVTYNPTTGLITVPAGVTTFAVKLPTVDDTAVEATPETVPLSIGGVSATGGILDNDSPAISKIEVGNPGATDDNVVEGNNLIFNVTLSTATTKTETYAFNLGGGTASTADYGSPTFNNGVTYNPTTGLITVPAGVTTFAVTLPTVDDTAVEATPETVPLSIGGVSATGGILDNDSPAISKIEVGNPGTTDDNVVEGNNLVFNVTLSTATTKTETYAFNLGGGTASAADYGTPTFNNGVTYNPTTGLITVPAGVTTFAVTLPTVDDTAVEATPETVPLSIGGVSATGGILDNDSPAISKIEVGNPGTSDDNVVEGNNLVFNVTLSTATTKVESYAFNLGGGTASTADYGTPTFNNGVTYDLVTGKITVPAGVTTFAVTLPTVDDTAVEATPETVPLSIGGVSATGGILDNDSPAISKIEVGNPGASDDNVVEGNNLVFNVTLSTATTKTETYAFNLGGGTASAADYGTPTFNNGVTYNPTTGLITVPAGVTTFAVTLPTVDDTAVEATPETVPLSIGGVSATGGILDNDSPAISKIEVGNPGTTDDNVVEGNNLVFNVTLSTATTKTETYAFNLGGGIASAADYGTPTFNNGVTYNPTTGLITVPAGVITFAVTLPTVDDTAVEATPETVPLSIGGVSATGGILDNDSPAISKIEVGNPGTSDDNVVEGNNLVFNVTLSTATTKTETYAFNLGGGSASAADYGTPSFNNGVTYDPATGLITVPAGVTTFAVTLSTVDDTAVEATPETVPLSIGGVSATGGILDNDSPAISKIEVGNPGTTDDNVVEGNNLVFNVTLSTATTKVETYAFNLGGGSASAADYGTPSFNNGVTYDPVTGKITVPAGVTTFAVTLPTVDDTAVEATPETVPLSIGGVSATGGILDNDSPAISKIEVGNLGATDDNVVEGNNLVFNVTLSTATTKVETYAFNLGGGTASTADYGTPSFNNGVTYDPVTGKITVPAGVITFAVTLPTVDDTAVEATPETVPLSIGGVSATGGILDNDSPAISKIEVGNPGTSDDNVVEGNNLVFNVTLSTATTKVETYAFNLGGGSASAADYGTPSFNNGVTYDPATGLITVPAGVTTFAVTLPTVDDTAVEATPETVPLSIGGVSATGGILDNDSPAISKIEVGNPGTSDDNVVEGNNLVFNVTLSTATTKVETYAFNLGGGSASAADYGTPSFNNGVTYDPVTGKITVPAGVTTFAVTLPTVDDTAVEATPETVPLSIGGVSATGGILDNDSPAISKIEVGNPGATDDNVVEGNNLVFNVTLSTATTKTETYAFNLGGGSASAADYGTPSFNNGVTYDPATGLITVPAGVTTFAVTLSTVDDTAVEATPETVPLSIGGVSATGGILDNDSPAISKIEVGNPGTTDDNVVEGNNLVFNVTLSTATTKVETYAFNLGGGSASAADYGTPSFNNGVTYDPVTGKITVPAGVTTFAVTLPTVDDTAVEATPETVPLSIGGVSATGGILDNDSPAISKIEVGNPGTTDDNVVEGNNLVFNVTLSTATTKVETYAFNLGGGSASAADYGTPSFNNGVTYDPATGLITVPAGVTTFAVTLSTVDDTAVEATPETVPLSIGGVSATGGILDNDSPAISKIEVGNPGTSDDNVVEGNNLVFNVTLSTATTKVETYAFNLGGGTASAADYGTATFNNGVTYNPTTGLITVPAGVITFAVTLPTVDDTAVEATPETVPLSIGGVSATGGILDNDSPNITGVEVGNPGVADDNVVEGNNLVFNVTLSTATTKVETYAFNLGGGTASTADYGTPTFNNGVTYDPVTGKITVPAGVTTFAVTLPTVDDTAVEATPETVPLSIGGVSATGGILDNDSPAISKIEVGNPGTTDDNVVEGNNLVFNVTLSTATTKVETYAFNLGGGTASTADYGTPSFNNGVTYDPVTGKITVPAGVITFAVTLPTVDDTAVEATPEIVPLSIGGVSATGGILDNDSPAISKIEVGNPGTTDDNVVEGNNLVFNVTLSTATTKVETYAFNLGGGTASTADYGTPSFNNGVTYDPVTGKITVPAGVTTFAVTLPTVDDTAVEATPETVPLSIGGVSATGGILDNDNPPVVANASATVSEEGLLGGIKDTVGAPTDATDSAVRTGTIAISDPDSSVLTTTLIAPTTALTSGGVALVWSGSNSQNLVATAGAGGPVVATISINNAGSYTVTLKAPLDHPVNSTEDIKSFNVGVRVSDGTHNSTGTLTVNVEDDAPVGQSQSANVQIPNVNSNLVLTLDVSGSMGDPSGITGKTRLQVAKEAITKLIDDYDVLGDVKVMLVTFSSSSTTQQSGGQTWMSVSEAKTILAGLVANGGTNYDAAVGQVTSRFADVGKIAGAQNIGYFFSDGAPGTGLGLDATEEQNWTNFLNTNDINSLALGLGTGVSATNLNPLAYNGTGSGSQANAIIVTDLSQLPPILRDTIVTPTAGDLTGSISGTASGFGADGGHINDITVDGVKYTFNVAGNSITTSAAAGSYIFDATTHQLKVNTVLGGQFAIDMDDGKYTYTPPVLKTAGSSENIGFTLIDNDGDLDQSNSRLTINVVPPAQGSTLQLTASTSAIADSTRGLHGEFFGYNNDPDKVGGVVYNVQTQDNTVGNLDNLADITSVINGRQGSNIVGTQTEASALASDATFIADAIKYGVTPTVTGNLGTNNAVTAGNAITSGNLYNFLGANNVVSDTAGLAATSTFGNTTDSIMRMVGGAYFAAGTYDIRVYADDGYRIAIDGTSVFEYNANQSPASRVQTGVVISEGMHSLEVLYWEQGGNAALQIEFKPSGAADSAYVTLGINDMALFHGTQTPVLTELQDIIEDPSNNGHYLIRSGQEVSGSNLSDTITGSAGRDIIHGGAGQDVISAGAGADRIEGGAGSDTLTGGLGADTFRWALADKGTVGAPDIDRITDFNSASYNAGGDRLDLRDLLQAENHTVGSGNLSQYLHFEKSGTDTIIHVSSAGGFTGPFNASKDDQRIVLSGVDLTGNGSLADSAIIQDLLNKGKLITD